MIKGQYVVHMVYPDHAELLGRFQHWHPAYVFALQFWKHPALGDGDVTVTRVIPKARRK